MGAGQRQSWRTAAVGINVRPAASPCFATPPHAEENRARLRELGGFVGGSERALPAGGSKRALPGAGATAGSSSGRPFADFVSPAQEAQRQAAMAEQSARRMGRQAEKAGKQMAADAERMGRTAAADAERAGRMAAADAKRARPLGGSRFRSQQQEQQRRQQQQWEDDDEDKWNL